MQIRQTIAHCLARARFNYPAHNVLLALFIRCAAFFYHKARGFCCVWAPNGSRPPDRDHLLPFKHGRDDWYYSICSIYSTYNPIRCGLPLTSFALFYPLGLKNQGNWGRSERMDPDLSKQLKPEIGYGRSVLGKHYCFALLERAKYGANVLYGCLSSRLLLTWKEAVGCR